MSAILARTFLSSSYLNRAPLLSVFSSRARSFMAAGSSAENSPGVEIYRLEEWRERALAGLDAGLRAQKTDPACLHLAEARKRPGEALMENELPPDRCRFRQGLVPIARPHR